MVLLRNKNKRRTALTILATTVILTLASVIPASASTTSVSFNYTGGVQTFSAPYTGTYTLEVWGAQGGCTNGGLGGYSQGNITLTQGDTLNIYVGGQGISSNVTTESYYNGGYNGGGPFYTGNQGYTSAGGGGGTDIRLNSTALTNRIIVAGGGGGGGTGVDGTIYSGNGGGTTGADGCTSAYSVPYCGLGGTQTYGGTGGYNNGTAGSGSLGQGGCGVQDAYGGSGGGGGYYGGGGASECMGAGGGSGYTGGLTSSTMSTGTQTGNGSATILYATPLSPTSLIYSNVTYTSATLSWQPVSLANSYNIYKNNTLIGTTTTTSYKDSLLTQNTQYTYTVTAVNGTLEGPHSLPVMLTTQQYLASIQATTGAPQKVRILLVSPNGLYYYDETTKSNVGLSATTVTKQSDVSSAGQSLITIKQ